MLDLRRLRLLRELARRGTITAVAEALSYSPSAVSQQLAALEKEPPRARRVRLTPKPISSSRTPRSFLRRWNEPKLHWPSSWCGQFMVRSDESCMPCHGPRRRITLAA